MRAVFADPRTDFVFKRVFRAEARKPLLVTLLNDLLELEGERRIVEVQHLGRDEHVKVPELRLSVIDVKCADAAGRRFVVKMQVLVVEGLLDDTIEVRDELCVLTFAVDLVLPFSFGVRIFRASTSWSVTTARRSAARGVIKPSWCGHSSSRSGPSRSKMMDDGWTLIGA